MFRTPERAYLILSLERTGSGLLCDALRRTGRLGTPSELFGARAAARETSLPDYVDAVARETARGGVFGAKLHRNQYLELERAGEAGSPLDLVPSHCRPGARMVLLTRDDRRRQAISILLARATGVWALAGDPAAAPVTAAANRYWAERLDGSPEDVRAALDDILATIDDEERGWLGWLEDSEIGTLRISYEELTGDYPATVARVARHVAGVELDPGEIPAPRSRRQRDERTERLLDLWVRPAAAP